MSARYILSSVWVRLSIFSYSIYGAACFQFTQFPHDGWENILLCLIIIIKSEVWTIIHCLGLGHETLVCAVCLFIFLLPKWPLIDKQLGHTIWSSASAPIYISGLFRFNVAKTLAVIIKIMRLILIRGAYIASVEFYGQVINISFKKKSTAKQMSSDVSPSLHINNTPVAYLYISHMSADVLSLTGTWHSGTVMLICSRFPYICTHTCISK